ncbi:MAG: hypothetical protein ABSE73_11990 [Planctomycetota bacterium]
MLQQPLAKKLALCGLVIAGFALFGGIVGQAYQVLEPMATIMAGCLVALAIAEVGQRE